YGRSATVSPTTGTHGATVRFPRPGRVAELADAQDSGSCDRKIVGVQVPPRPPGVLPDFEAVPEVVVTLDCNHFATISVRRVFDGGCPSPSIECQDGRRLVFKKGHDPVVASMDRLLDVAGRAVAQPHQDHL